jgi:hypothetical protein
LLFEGNVVDELARRLAMHGSKRFRSRALDPVASLRELSCMIEELAYRL